MLRGPQSPQVCPPRACQNPKIPLRGCARWSLGQERAELQKMLSFEMPQSPREEDPQEQKEETPQGQSRGALQG